MILCFWYFSLFLFFQHLRLSFVGFANIIIITIVVVVVVVSFGHTFVPYFPESG